jgi:predicted kinase
MLITMSGLPGTGKSELAQAVGRALEIPVLSVDPIEAAMLRAAIARGFDTGLAAYLVVEAVADAQLALGMSVIVDAVNAMEWDKAMWRDLAARHGAALKVIECRCSDDALHRERLRRRRRGTADVLPEPTWEKVQERRLEYTPWAEPVLSVDSVESCESNCSRVIDWLALGPT